MVEEIPDCLLLLQKFAGLLRAPKHVQKAYLENPPLHKMLSSLGGKATAAKKKLPSASPKAKPMKQMTFDKTLDEVPHEEGLKMIQDLKKKIGGKDKTAAVEDPEQNIKNKLNYFQRNLLNAKIMQEEQNYRNRLSRHAFDLDIHDKYMNNSTISNLVRKIQNSGNQQIDHIGDTLAGGLFGGAAGMAAGLPFSVKSNKGLPMLVGAAAGAGLGGYGMHRLRKSYAEKVNQLPPEELEAYIKADRDKKQNKHDSLSSTLARDYTKADRLLAPAALAASLTNLGAGAATAMGARSLDPVREKTVEQLLANSGVADRVKVNPPGRGAGDIPLLANNAYFKPDTNKFVPKGPLGEIEFIGEDFYKPGILAHELGHANIQGSKGLVGMLQRKLYGPTMLANKFGLGGIANSLGSYYATKDEDNVGKGALKGGLTGAAMNAGILVPEFEASRRGIQNLLKSNLKTKSKITNSLSLLPAFLTYLAGTSGVGAGVGALHAHSNKKAKRKKKVKTGEVIKLSKSQILRDLLEAKKLSDDRDYIRKNEIIRKIVTKYPKQFKVDSHLNRTYVGLTHVPTGFKIHARKSGLPSEIFNN